MMRQLTNEELWARFQEWLQERELDGLWFAPVIRKLLNEHKELKSDYEDLCGLERRLATLLTRTANALKGPPPESVLWDWSDLPQEAKRARAIIDRILELRGPWMESADDFPEEHADELHELLKEERIVRGTRTARAIIEAPEK